MTALRHVAWIAVLCALAACEARRSEAPKPKPGGKTSAAAAPAEPASTPPAEPAPPAAVPPPRRADGPCPECEGTGLCAICGEDRACRLCLSSGRCGLCGGTGVERDGECAACGGGGRCRECAGDGVVAVADPGAGGARGGACRGCRRGSGLCAACGGESKSPDEPPCPACGGAAWCVDCRGAGADPWCGGTGFCPTCEGHGALSAGRPAAGWPPLRLWTTSGFLVGRILERPGATVSIEHSAGGRPVREAIIAKNVDPAAWLAAFRRFADPASADDLRTAGEFALRAGDELLFSARRDLRAAAARSTPTTVGALLAEVERRIARRLLADAEEALARSDWAAFRPLCAAAARLADDETSQLARRALEKARDAQAREEAALSPEAVERRAAAAAGRLVRAVRRAEAWRARAAERLARTGASVADLLSAREAATIAAREAVLAAFGAPAGASVESALRERDRAREIATRAEIAVAARLLQAGLVERARAVAALALAAAPEDEGARRFAAEVDAALARAAAPPPAPEEEER